MSRTIEKKRKELDPYTFGDSKGAIILAKILSQSEYEKYRSQVSVKFIRFCTLMRAIHDVKDLSSKSNLCLLIITDARKKVGDWNAPKVVKSYLLSIMNRGYRIQMGWGNLENIK